VSASLLLRDFHRAGVRVSLGADGFLISPPDVAPAALEDALRLAWREVKAVLEALPAPGHCQICGDVTNGPTNWPDTGHINCVECAVIGATQAGHWKGRNTTWPGKRALAEETITPAVSGGTARFTASTSGPVRWRSFSPSSTLTTERTVNVIVATLPNTGPHPKPWRRPSMI